MTKIDDYRQKLGTLAEWDPFLLQESGLPGPRGNLELAHAVADLGDEALFRRYLAVEAARAPTGSPYEFLAVCGAIGLGRLLAGGDRSVLPELRCCAADPRWRLREGVAMALQRWGRADMAGLLQEMKIWSRGSLLEQRAAAAALCEPALLTDPAQVEQVLQILDDITASIQAVTDRRSDDFRALKKGLGYCWSVAVAALPAAGQPMLERWFIVADRDIRWIMRENLKKKRLGRVDPAWVEKWQAHLG